MRLAKLMIAATGALALTACANKAEEPVAVAAPLPPPPGSITGSTAADRDGDGIVDGYYTADGVYHANYVPAPPPPPPLPTRRGERG